MASAEKNFGRFTKKTKKKEIFTLSGPSWLTAVDWENFHHRKSVAASLVQGVYILERDRQLNRRGHQSEASPWFNSFHFQLITPLIDAVDSSIFGAIYQYNNPFFCHHKAPKYVIAFRGTLNKPDSILRDLKLDIKTIRSKLHQDSRFHRAMQAVQDVVAAVEAANIWLAGHSLGSAIALCVGKHMTKRNYPIDNTYLFNPPFISLSVEIISNPIVKQVIGIAKSFVKAGIAAVKGKHRTHDSFFALSKWVPYLFVNRADHICSGYIGYFENRKTMKKVRAEKIERRAAPTSMVSMIFGEQESNCEPLHLLPSACLTVNMIQSPDFKRAHGIQQWWDPSFDGQSKRHLLT